MTVGEYFLRAGRRTSPSLTATIVVFLIMKSSFLLTTAAGLGLALTSCSTQQQQWGLGGAAAGAAAGAVFGDDSSDVIRGAAIGGAAGAGAAVYRENQNQNNGNVAPNFPNQTPRSIPQPTGYPTATLTKDQGIVLSPYPPYNKVNVTGFQPGSKARDPYTKQIFLVP